MILQSSHSALHFVGGSISRHPPPTEKHDQGTSDYGFLTGGFEPPRPPYGDRQPTKYPQSTPLTEMYEQGASPWHQAGGTCDHGIGRLSNEVTATFATQLYFCRFAPNRYAAISTARPFCAWSKRGSARKSASPPRAISLEITKLSLECGLHDCRQQTIQVQVNVRFA